jgi:hypothetical protein
MEDKIIKLILRCDAAMDILTYAETTIADKGTGWIVLNKDEGDELQSKLDDIKWDLRRILTALQGGE